MLTLTAGPFEDIFFWGRVNLILPLHISRRIEPISVQLYTIAEQPIWCRFEVKNVYIICYMLTLFDYLEQGNFKKSKIFLKTVYTGEENLSMKSSGKMCLVIIWKVIKNQGLNPSLESTVLEKPQGVVKLTPLQPFTS